MQRSLPLFAALLAASVASAQHADINPVNTGGKLTLTYYNYDSGTVTPASVFAARFDEFYAVNDPGFSTEASGSNIPGNTALRWDFLPMSVGGYSSNLLYWDGLGDEPDFGPAPTDDYSISLFGRNNPVAAWASDDELVTGDILGITGPTGALHEHNFFFLDDNGDGTNDTLAAAGYYLIAMQVRMTGLETSDPFVMVWGTPDSNALLQAQVAVPWVEENLESLVGGGLPGDFNGDGAVDAADYTVWRDGLASTFVQEDYTTWADNYGATAATASAVAVPEPGAVCLLSVAALLLLDGVPPRKR